MNGYLRELFGQEVSAKDLRTWHATVLAAVGLAVSGHAAMLTRRVRLQVTELQINLCAPQARGEPHLLLND